MRSESPQKTAGHTRAFPGRACFARTLRRTDRAALVRLHGRSNRISALSSLDYALSDRDPPRAQEPRLTAASSRPCGAYTGDRRTADGSVEARHDGSDAPVP